MTMAAVQGGVLASGGDEGVQMMLALWAVFTGILWAQTLNINIALFFLFGGLTCTFALLSAGVTHPKANKVGLLWLLLLHLSSI